MDGKRIDPKPCYEKQKAAGVTHFTTIHLDNLPEETTEHLLVQHFNKFGSVGEVRVNMNEKGQCKGQGYVTFSTVDEALAAVKDGDLTINGQTVAVTAPDGSKFTTNLI